MINCGIIGFGKMGQIRARSIEESGIGRVSCVYDPSTIESSPYRVVPTDLEVLSDPEVNAVFVCTPNHRIKPLVIAALQAGKHVFSEKPPGKCAGDVEEMIAAEQSSAGKTLMFGFNHRHHGSIQKMKQIIDSGSMGRVLWMRGRYGKEVDASFFEGWRADPNLAGGGIMLDQGIHMLDLFLHLGGGFDEVHAFVSNLFWKIEGIEDNVFAILRSSKTGACASLHSTMTQWRYLFSLEVFCERGALVLNGLKTNSGAYGDEDLAIKHNDVDPEEGRFEREEHIIYHSDTSWLNEVKMFFSSIESASPVKLGSSQDALALMRVMDKIYAR
jgi:predicted dehydrogenase